MLIRIAGEMMGSSGGSVCVCVIVYVAECVLKWSLNGPTWCLRTAVVCLRAQKAFSLFIKSCITAKNTSLFM